jgi:zinc transporter ZupT
MEVGTDRPLDGPDRRLDFRRPWPLIRRMMSGGAALLPVIVLTLYLGMAIYHYVEGLAWSDAFLNSAMLLGGMGPLNPINTTLGKWLIGFYALFAGLVFLVLAGIMLAPVLHHVVSRLHRREGGDGGEGAG